MRDGFSPVRSRPGVIIEPGGVCNASWVHSHPFTLPTHWTRLTT